jgi:L-ascorbate metabolism protein UlaG (beta-lactamase superfamily)
MHDCHVPENKIDLFRSFFSDDCNKLSNHPYLEQGVRVRYFGHACVLLETTELSILIDPVLGYQPNPTHHDRFTAAHLPDKIDYVLITHNHQDHLLLETLLQLRYKIKHIVVPSCNNGLFADPSLKLILSKLGFQSIITMDEFDHVTLKDGQITALPFYGEHGDLNIQTKRAYHIILCNHTFLFLADSNNLDPMLYEHIATQTGPIETIFIGMECKGAPASWLYGPLFPAPIARNLDQSRRLSGSNAEKAWQAVKLFSPTAVYVYAMGMEPWLSYIMAIHYDDNSMPIIESNKFVNTCRENNILSKRLYGKDEWIYAV